ncbi:MAG: Kef family K(+) transporter [Rhizobiales bacterium]|nr:Kef family K(+) transporter [Hyphomicrobiales bacterium]
MAHQTPLITTVVLALVLAFVLGALAHRFKISPVVGYLLAGVILGPFTPGYVADQNLANELAEIGVILLMFGVGLHFSLEDLLSVRAIAIPGAMIQIAAVAPIGMAFAWALGWPMGAGLVFGLALSVASTVVVLRTLQEGRLIETERGRIAVGWLIVEDLVMVLTLVLLPALAGMFKGGVVAETHLSALLVPVGWTLGKVVVFIAGMLIIGTRVIPSILHYVAHTGSRELFRLAVLAIALGFAYAAAALFDVSFALGAFFAGMVLSESQLSQRAAQESLPLRDAFAVLFFVSVGMLFNPSIVLQAPIALLATILVIVVVKAVIGYGLVRLFRHPEATALMIAASRAQIGEFSFILAGLGVSLALLPEAGRNLILAGAIISILFNPLLFAAIDHWPHKKAAEPAPQTKVSPEETPAHEPLPVTQLRDHVVLVGHGRVGSFISAVLQEKQTPFLVIEDNRDIVKDLRAKGMEAIAANAANPDVVRAANMANARCLLVAVPDAFEGGQVVEQARAVNAALPIIARAHSQAEIDHLKRHGASIVVMGEHEIAKTMIEDIPAQS